MGYFSIISETGFPHSACVFIIGNRPAEWRGFKPTISKTPYCRGYVDKSDRSDFIKNFVEFAIDDSVLENALHEITTSYENLDYRAVLGPDCINLSVDAARYCGLQTPPPPNLLPDNLVEALKRLNTGINTG